MSESQDSKFAAIRVDHPLLPSTPKAISRNDPLTGWIQDTEERQIGCRAIPSSSHLALHFDNSIRTTPSFLLKGSTGDGFAEPGNTGIDAPLLLR